MNVEKIEMRDWNHDDGDDDDRCMAEQSENGLSSKACCAASSSASKRSPVGCVFVQCVDDCFLMILAVYILLNRTHQFAWIRVCILKIFKFLVFNLIAHRLMWIESEIQFRFDFQIARIVGKIILN